MNNGLNIIKNNNFQKELLKNQIENEIKLKKKLNKKLSDINNNLFNITKFVNKYYDLMITEMNYYLMLELKNNKKYKTITKKELIELKNKNYMKDLKGAEKSREYIDFLINVVINGWSIEDYVIELINNNNTECKLNGSDKIRSFSNKATNESDFYIKDKKNNSEKFFIELQTIKNDTLLIKEKKLNNLIYNKIPLLVFDKRNQNFYYYYIEDLEDFKDTAENYQKFGNKYVYQKKINQDFLIDKNEILNEVKYSLLEENIEYINNVPLKIKKNLQSNFKSNNY